MKPRILLKNMKPRILYAYNGVGFGHAATALAMKEEIQKRYNATYIVSGIDNNKKLIDDSIELKGFVFKTDKNGIIEPFRTIAAADWLQNLKDINNINLSDYDFVINDHEPSVSYSAFLSDYDNIFSISHQASFLYKETPRVKVPFYRWFDEFSFKYVTKSCSLPLTEHNNLGTHYRKYNSNILYPIIRNAIIQAEKTEEDFCLVYLPWENSNNMLSIFSKFQNQKFIVYDPLHKDSRRVYKNVTVKRADKDEFLKDLVRCSSCVTNSGFLLTSELMYLGKKFLTIPQRRQLEQESNALALKLMGLYVNPKLDYDSLSKMLNGENRTLEHQPVSSPGEILDIIESRVK